MRSALLPAVAALVVAAGTPIAGQAAGEGVDEVLDCVAQNLPAETSVQTLEFQSRDRSGGGRSIESRMRWRRFDDGLSRVLLRVRKPADLKGSGVLLIEKEQRSDMFLYLPDLRRVRRVTSRMLSGSLFGSDFTYEDFSQVQGMSIDGRSERLPDTKLDGVPVHVISHYPAEGSGSAYARVTSYVEAERCVPLRSEMYQGDRLRKVMTVDRSSIFEQDGVRLPLRLLMKDLRDESQTELVVTEIEVGVEIPEKVFSTTYLGRPRAD